MHREPKIIFGIIHHTLIASKIFSSATKSVNRFSSRREVSKASKPSFFNKGQVDKKKEQGCLQEVAIVSHLKRWSATKRKTSALHVGRKVTLTVLVLKGK